MKKGDAVLSRGGPRAGLLLCQWIRYLGARGIGTMGSEVKDELAAQQPAMNRSAGVRRRGMIARWPTKLAGILRSGHAHERLLSHNWAHTG